jgi:hypothetical protein
MRAAGLPDHRVADLDAVLAAPRSEGVKVDDLRQPPPDR